MILSLLGFFIFMFLVQPWSYQKRAAHEARVGSRSQAFFGHWQELFGLRFESSSIFERWVWSISFCIPFLFPVLVYGHASAHAFLILSAAFMFCDWLVFGSREVFFQRMVSISVLSVVFLGLNIGSVSFALSGETLASVWQTVLSPFFFILFIVLGVPFFGIHPFVSSEPGSVRDKLGFFFWTLSAMNWLTAGSVFFSLLGATAVTLFVFGWPLYIPTMDAVRSGGIWLRRLRWVSFGCLLVAALGVYCASRCFGGGI